MYVSPSSLLLTHVAPICDNHARTGSVVLIANRIPLVCRPIPGESDWVRHCLTGNSTKNDTTARLPETESDVDTDSADGSAKKRRTTRAGRGSTAELMLMILLAALSLFAA